MFGIDDETLWRAFVVANLAIATAIREMIKWSIDTIDDESSEGMVNRAQE